MPLVPVSAANSLIFLLRRPVTLVTVTFLKSTCLRASLILFRAGAQVSRRSSDLTLAQHASRHQGCLRAWIRARGARRRRRRSHRRGQVPGSLCLSAETPIVMERQAMMMTMTGWMLLRTVIGSKRYCDACPSWSPPGSEQLGVFVHVSVPGVSFVWREHFKQMGLLGSSLVDVS